MSSELANMGRYYGSNTDEGTQQLFSLMDVLLFVQRNIALIIAVAVLTVILTAAYVYSKTPLYTATTTLVINVNQKKVIDFDTANPNAANYDEDESIVSELDIIQSRPLAERVITEFNLDQDPEFKPTALASKGVVGSIMAILSPPKVETPTPASVDRDQMLSRDQLVDSFQSRMTVKRKPKSYIIEISFTSRTPDKARRISDAIADAYISSQLENKFTALQDANTWLSKKLTDMQQNLAESERKVQKFREENNLVETEAGGVTVKEQQLAELNTQLSLSRAALAQAEAKLDNAHNSADSTSEVLNSNLIQMLRAQETEVLRKKADLSNRYGPKHPRMINVNAEIADLEDKIQTEIGKILKSLENDVIVAKDREAALEENVQSIQKNSESGLASVQLAELVREMNANKALYEAFLTRYKQTSEGSGAEQADARIVSNAEMPRAPSFPRTALILPASLIAGIVLGILTACALETLDTTFKNTRALEHVTHLPVVGMLPELRKKNDPTSLTVYFETLKSAFVSLSLVKGTTPKVFMVTSSTPNEGKTYFSLSFAQMLAQSGKRVLILDTDLKRAELTKHVLKEKFSFGFNDLMSQSLTPEKMVIKNIHPNLDFIPCKPSTANSQDLLSSKAMESLMTWLRANYDHILFDTPPVMAVSDAVIVAKMVDFCLFLVRWGKTSRQVVKASMRLLVPTGATMALLVTRTHVNRLKSYGSDEAAYYYDENKNY